MELVSGRSKLVWTKNVLVFSLKAALGPTNLSAEG